MKYKLLVATLLITALTPAPAIASHSWNGYHWERSTPALSLSLLDSTTTSAWGADLITTKNDWNESTVLNLSILAGGNSPDCDFTLGSVRVCNGTYGNNGWLGLARIMVSGGHIQWGTAQVNDYYFNTSTYNNLNARLHVLCQEVGHTFGLDHQGGKKSVTCMNDRFGLFDPDATAPNAHDYAQLESIYCHLDDGTPCTSDGGTGKGKGKGNNGKKPDRTGQDGSSTILTYIFWR